MAKEEHLRQQQGKGDGKGRTPEAAKGELRSSISQGADETKRA